MIHDDMNELCATYIELDKAHKLLSERMRNTKSCIESVLRGKEESETDKYIVHMSRTPSWSWDQDALAEMDDEFITVKRSISKEEFEKLPLHKQSKLKSALKIGAGRTTVKITTKEKA